MSDNPLKFKAKLLEDCSTEEKREFAAMLTDMCAIAELQNKGHRCWFHVPTPTEYERMRKFGPDYRCPKCGKGWLVVEITRWNLGDDKKMVCRHSGCGFKEEVGDEW